MSTRRGSWRPSNPAAGARSPFLPWSSFLCSQSRAPLTSSSGTRFPCSPRGNPQSPHSPGSALGSRSVSAPVGRVRRRRPWPRTASRVSAFAASPGEKAPAGLSARSFPLLRLPGATGDLARPAKGSLWKKKAQLSLLSNLEPQPLFFQHCGAALCPGGSLIRSKLESRPPLYAWPPLSHLPPIMVLRKPCKS